MNDALALDAPVATKPTKPVTRGLAWASTTRRKPVSSALPADSVPRPTAPVSIEAKLRIGAPRLLMRSDETTTTRFVDLVRSHLHACLDNALTAFRRQVGVTAAALDDHQRMALQDLALTVRDVDDLVPQAASALSPSELVAILASACEAHAPDSLDASRCRQAALDGRNPLAREAMLDLATAGPAEHAAALFRHLVATHAIGVFELSGRLTPETIERLRAACHGPEIEPADIAGDRARLDGDLSLRERLVESLRQGQVALATGFLASAAGVTRATVDAAICLRTARGLVSLAWRAGLDARCAASIQSVLGRLPPDQIIHATSSGAFSLTEPEMLWQCRFLARSQRTVTA